MSNLVLTYKGIEIRYDQFDDRWHFTLRRKMRSAPTVGEAKKLIDTPPVKADGLFQRTPVFVDSWRHGDGLVDATATSCDPSYGTNYVWIVQGKCREKARADCVYPATKNNILIARRVKALDKDLKKLNSEREKLMERMTSLDREIEKLNEKVSATIPNKSVA
jgi:hypothetical protein